MLAAEYLTPCLELSRSMKHSVDQASAKPERGYQGPVYRYFVKCQDLLKVVGHINADDQCPVFPDDHVP